MKKIFLLAIALFLLAACSAAPGANVAGEWKLVSYGDTPALPNVDTSIKFGTDGQVSGNVGCNSFGGSYEMKGDKITFGAMMSTLMFCEETSNQEQSVLSAFADGVSLQIKLDGDTLTITSPDGASVVLARK
ncbi:MAG: META domain-containing protein [Anaerolineales bacterium]|nr:META domain-containing protein [Anaerolineales bacterium]